MSRIICDFESKSLWFTIMHFSLLNRESIVLGFALIKSLTCKRSFYFSFFPSRFLWEALVHGSEEGSLPMVGLSPPATPPPPCTAASVVSQFTVSCFAAWRLWAESPLFQCQAYLREISDAGWVDGKGQTRAPCWGRAVCDRERNLWAAIAWLGEKREPRFH